MSAYVIFIRKQLRDQSGIDKYHGIVADSPMDNLEILVPSGAKFEVVEGDPVEGVVLLRFPDMKEVHAWYYSDCYQEGLPFRLAAGDYHVIFAEGDEHMWRDVAPKRA